MGGNNLQCVLRVLGITLATPMMAISARHVCLVLLLLQDNFVVMTSVMSIHWIDLWLKQSSSSAAILCIHNLIVFFGIDEALLCSLWIYSRARAVTMAHLFNYTFLVHRRYQLILGDR